MLFLFFCCCFFFLLKTALVVWFCINFSKTLITFILPIKPLKTFIFIQKDIFLQKGLLNFFYGRCFLLVLVNVLKMHSLNSC